MPFGKLRGEIHEDQQRPGRAPRRGSASADRTARVSLQFLNGKLGTNATAAQLHEYLESLHDYVGITGVYDFRDGSQQGLLKNSPVFMVRWDSEKQDFVQVSKAGGAPL